MCGISLSANIKQSIDSLLNWKTAMEYIELIAILAVLHFLFFSYMTGIARRDSGLAAPAVTGHESFERMYRVQSNTLEMIVIYLPSLLIAGKYWPTAVISGIGVIYIIGRFIYWRAYIAEPAKRGLGFMLSFFPVFILVTLALIGVILSIFSQLGS